MLARTDLRDVATTHTNGDLGHAETLYIQDLILHSIYHHTTRELIFKGGTALAKLHNLDRFSEDLDFTQDGTLDRTAVLDHIVTDLERFNVTTQERSYDNSTAEARLGVEGPLYVENRQSLCFIRIDINTESTVVNPVVQRYTPPFQDIPAFELLTLTEPELFAEKIRAVLTRNTPRDIYDTYHLSSKGVIPEPELITLKLSYYDEQYSKEALLQTVRERQSTWDQLQPLVYHDLPNFDKVLTTLTQALPDSEE